MPVKPAVSEHKAWLTEAGAEGPQEVVDVVLRGQAPVGEVVEVEVVEETEVSKLCGARLLGGRHVRKVPATSRCCLAEFWPAAAAISPCMPHLSSQQTTIVVIV